MVLEPMSRPSLEGQLGFGRQAGRSSRRRGGSSSRWSTCAETVVCCEEHELGARDRGPSPDAESDDEEPHLPGASWKG